MVKLFINVKNYSFIKRSAVKPKLLWVRSLHAIYNPLMAIYVIYELKKYFDDIELCMVGPIKDDSYNKILKLADNLGVLNYIKIVGWLSKAEWIELSKKYDIFINTTNIDNQPVSVIEAMALGMPIVSTNVGGISKLIQDGENGLLVKKGDTIQMADKISSLIESESLTNKLSFNGRKFAESLDENIVLRLWYKILDPILNE